jgi:hypothetical protein
VHYRVLIGQPEYRRSDFERDLNAEAAKGYRLCGLAISSPDALIALQSYAYVAVLARRDGDAVSPREYRVIRTTGRREEWRAVEQAGRDGFIVRPMVWRPQAMMAAVGDVTYIAERDPASPQPVEFTLKWHGNDHDLEQTVVKLAKEGHRIHAVWTGNDQVSVLMAKPIGGAYTDPVDYQVEALTGFRVSPFNGGLIRMLPFEGERISFQDKRKPGEYETVERDLADQSPGLLAREREFRVVREQMNARAGDRGYWPVDLAIRQVAGRTLLTLEAIFEKRPQ